MIKLTPIKPIGKRKSFCHINHANRPHEWKYVDMDVYEPTGQGQEIKKLRKGKRISLFEAAKAIGIKASDLSGIEHYKATVSDDDCKLIINTIERMN